MQIDWHKYLRYEDGKLIWLEREGDSREVKIWNTRYAGTEAGSTNANGYMKIKFLRKDYRLHRVIWEMLKGEIPEHLQIDHINANRLDNRIENLQLVTAKHNSQRGSLMSAKGYSKRKECSTRPYRASRTDKYFGTQCGAYMSFMTAFVQGEMNGNNR